MAGRIVPGATGLMVAAVAEVVDGTAEAAVEDAGVAEEEAVVAAIAAEIGKPRSEQLAISP